MINWHDENQVQQLKKQLVELAENMISKRLGFLEGVRRFCNLSSNFNDSERSENFNLFIAIESETDHLPIGSVRKLWSDEALVRVDKEVEESERFYRKQVEAACQEIIKNFS